MSVCVGEGTNIAWHVKCNDQKIQVTETIRYYLHLSSLIGYVR